MIHPRHTSYVRLDCGCGKQLDDDGFVLVDEPCRIHRQLESCPVCHGAVFTEKRDSHAAWHKLTRTE